MNKEKALKNQGLEFREDIIIWGGDSYLYFHSYYFYKIYRNRKAFRKKVAHNGNSGFF